MEIEKILISIVGGLGIGTGVIYVLRTFSLKYFDMLEKENDETRHLLDAKLSELDDDIRSLYERTNKIAVIERDLELLRDEHLNNHRRRWDGKTT